MNTSAPAAPAFACIEATTGLTDAERIELAQIIEEANRREAQQHAADCAAERYSEARVHNRNPRINPHD